jgi:enoyl-CoA hydratase/carnithine racemase
MRKEREDEQPSRRRFNALPCGQVRERRSSRSRSTAWEKTRVEGAKLLQRLLELPIPVVGVANGPATVHSEYLLVADIHLASERASYGDFPHPAFGLTGGDGLHVVWEEIVGTARAKWLLWTGERIDAQTALQWGVVSEVVAHERVLERGIEIARSLAAKPPLYRTLQKQTLNLNLRPFRTSPSGWRSNVSLPPTSPIKARPLTQPDRQAPSAARAREPPR